MALAIRKAPSIWRIRSLTTSLMVFALMLQPMYGLVAGQVANAAPNGDVIVRAANQQGWSGTDTVAGGARAFIADPQAPYGSGALQMTTTSETASKSRYSRSASQIKLSEVVSGLSYSTKQIAASFGAGLPAYQLEMCLGGNYIFGSCLSGFTTLTYEPYVSEGNAAVQNNTWQTWSVSAGKLYSSRAFGSLQASQGTYTYTLAQILSEFPNAKVTRVGVNVGSNNPSYNVLVDGFRFSGTVYDFEPVANPVVIGENFNTHSGTDYKGLNVGFNVNDFGTVSSISVALYQGETLLATNTSNSALLGLVNGGTNQLSTPFITDAGTYEEAFWNLGAHSLTPSTKPTKAIVTVTGSNGTRSAELLSLAEPNGWVYESLFPVGLPIHESPVNNAVINYNDFNFDWNDVEGAVSYELQNSTDPAVTEDGSFVNVMWTGDYQNIQPTVSQARSVGATGTWYWQVRAIDAYGNKSDWTSPWSITIDQNAPDAPMLSATDLNSGDVTNQAAITATWTKPSDDTAKYEYQYWNNIPGNPYKESTPWSTEVFGESRTGEFTEGQGTHYFRVRAIDHAGNTSGWSNTFVVVYDTTDPNVKIDLNRSSYIVSGDRVSSASNPEIEASDANLDRIELWKNGAITGHVWSATTSSRRANIKFLGEGTYTVKAYDKAGNVSEFVVTIDNTAPTAGFTFSNNNGNALTKENVIVTLTATEPIQTPSGWTATEGSDTVFTRSYSNNGKQEVVITDKAGNASAPQKFEVKRIDRNAPTILGITNGATVRGSVALVIFDPKYEGYDGFDKLHGLTVNGVNKPTIEGPGKTYLYAASNEGEYTVVATDKAGNSTTLEFTIDNTAPEATILSPNSGDVVTTANSLEIALMATDTVGLRRFDVTLWEKGDDRSDGSTMKASWSTLVPTAEATNHTAAFTLPTDLNLVEGEYTIYFTATDLAGNSKDATNVNFAVVTPSVDASDDEDEETLLPSTVIQPLFTPAVLGNTPIIQPFQQGFIGNNPAAQVDTDNETNNSEDNEDVLGEQASQTGTPLEDTGEVLGLMDHKFFGIAWYWYLVILAALVGAWLFIAAAIRRNREEA